MVFQEQLKDIPDADSMNYDYGEFLLGEGKDNRRYQKKGKYRLPHLVKKRTKQTVRVITKSSEINDLIDVLYQVMTTVREELAQLNDMFIKLLAEIHVENKKLEEDYTKEQWCDDTDQKLFSFKHKVRAVSRIIFFQEMGW